MKKTILVAVLVSVCLATMATEAMAQQPPPPAQPPQPLWPQPGQVAGATVGAKPGAVVLSLVMPGTGEWLNRDFQGQFPIGECLIGYICCLVQVSSALDASAGDRAANKIRIDFWSKPQPGQ